MGLFDSAADAIDSAVDKASGVFDRGVSAAKDVASGVVVERQPFIKSFCRLCMDGFNMGWHEANGGNLSYRMTSDEVASCKPYFSEERPWVEMGMQVDNLRGMHFVVTGSGKYLRNMVLDPIHNLGIVQVNDVGAAWRIVWGLEPFAKPTSELSTHFMGHSVRMNATDGANRVIYHAHCPNIIALSTLVEPDARVWTRILWKSMTECVIIFPHGVGVVPWMVPGGTKIAQATAELMAQYGAVAWTQHGAFVSGDSLDAAFGMMHTIEKGAGLYLAARQANGGKEPEYLIDDEQLREVCNAFGVEPNAAFLDARAARAVREVS